MQTVSPLGHVPGLDPLALAGAVCARICHDLAGSVGSLTAMLELAAEDEDPEALALAITLSSELGARLRLLRAAWGAGSEVPPLPSLLAGLPGADRLTLDSSAVTTIETETLRLALSLLLVAAAALPRGGTIRVAGSDLRLTVEVEGPRAAWPEALAACIASDAALAAASDLPRSMSVALTCLQARALGRTITLDSATRLTVAP